jgi:hypothetical protein
MLDTPGESLEIRRLMEIKKNRFPGQSGIGRIMPS